MPEVRNDLRVDQTEAAVRDAMTSRSSVGYAPTSMITAGTVTAPSVPSSTTALPNPFACRAVVYISAGTVTVVNVGGQVTGLTTPATVVLEAYDSITLTYSVAPSWKWSLIP